MNHKQLNKNHKTNNGKNMNLNYSHTEQIHQIALQNQVYILKNLELEKYGLDFDQAEERIEKYGENVIKKQKFHWFLELIKTILNPFNLVLTVIATYNLVMYIISKDATGYDLVGAIIVILMIVLSSAIGYFQEVKSYLKTKKLNVSVSNTATVIRLKANEKVKLIQKQNNVELIKQARELKVEKLVPGDLIYLSSGDMLPCDVRILWSNDLFINQSPLTGESISIEKHAQVDEKMASILDYENICYMGTSVVSGSAIVIAINTGKATYLSAISKAVATKQSENSFNKGIKKISWILIAFTLALVTIVFAISGYRTSDWLNAALFAISIAVGLTPEMLPLIVSSNLIKGANKMSKAKVVIKKLEAVQNLGAIDILCTDKTGTLTEDKIQLVEYFNLEKKRDEKLIKMLYFNSFFQTCLKNPMDKAILHHINENNLHILKENYLKIDEIPFDFTRRKLSIIVKNPENEHILVSKGAIEEVIKSCNRIDYQGKVVPLTDELKRQVEATTFNMNNKGYRVIGVAYSSGHKEDDYYSVKDEQDLIFAGFATFLDVPKPSAKKMLKILETYGVKLKILTGDNEKITLAVCERIDMKIKGVISGDRLEQLSESELKKVCETYNIFVKLTPLQKVKIIEVLQKNNHQVGFMGDGINDAPVLKRSDVAISVNNATDIAKDASDIILLEKSLVVLEKGIIEGRKTFGNILKYIKITIASNFGNVISVLIAAAWLPFLPMLPIHILFQNLLYDISQTTIAFDNVDKDFLKTPQPWTTKHLLLFMFVNGLVSSIFDILTFTILGYALKAFEDDNATLFQTGWFVQGLLSQILVVQMLRTKDIPLFQSSSPWTVNISLVLIVMIGAVLPYTPIVGSQMQLVPPPTIYYLYLAIILASYCMVSQLAKMGYIKVFKTWL